MNAFVVGLELYDFVGDIQHLKFVLDPIVADLEVLEARVLPEPGMQERLEISELLPILPAPAVEFSTNAPCVGFLVQARICELLDRNTHQN